MLGQKSNDTNYCPYFSRTPVHTRVNGGSCMFGETSRNKMLKNVNLRLST